MNRVIALPLAALLWAQPAPPAAQQASQPQTAADRFRGAGALQLVDAYVAREMQRHRTPGLAIAITARDGLIAASTYGFADVRARVPLTPAHLFEIGSISKSFTAVALLQQRDAGRFDPQQPITKYLPWFSIQSSYAPITGHHLLTHTAGIPRDRDDVPSSRYQAAALRDRVAGSAPGSRYAYSNVGFQVLGYALEAIAGRPYPDVIRDGILRPLGMNSSDAQFTHDTRVRLAVGYEDMFDDRPPHPSHPLMPAPWLEYAAGDGSIVSTAEDMAAYVRMLLNGGRGPEGPIISPASFGLLTSKAAGTGERQWYGYGMGIREIDGRTVLAHSGGMVGYSSFLMAEPAAGIGVIVLVNGPAAPAEMAAFALDVARAALSGSALPALPAPDEPLSVPNAAEYAGTYTDADGRKIDVIGENGRLWIVHRGERVPLERRGRDRFYVNHDDFALFLLQFSRDPAGQVVELTHGGRWFAGARYTGPRTFDVPEAWRTSVGHYRTTHAWFNNFRVVVRKGELLLINPSGGEERLTPLENGEFVVGGKESAERLRFDTIVDGAALRATLSGVPYYRSFTP